MYNPKSLKAEEFISDEEILDTLEYAEKNISKFRVRKQLVYPITQYKDFQTGRYWV